MTEHSNSLSPLNHLQNSGSLNNIPSNTDLIQSGHYVFLQLPSENLRLIQLKENKWVELGKFGKFNANSILNQPFGWTYRIKEDHTLEKVIEELEESDSDSEQEMTLKNNKTIRDMNTNQKLSYDEIMELKVSKKGEELIEEIISNHAEFEKKSDFSKQKYILRKRKRFLNHFTPTPVTSISLCDYFFSKHTTKIRDLRSDVLSIMLNAANVRAYSRLLLVDDTHGLLTAAVLERMDGHGEVFVLHEAQSNNLEIIKYMNLSEEKLRPLKSLPISRAFPLDEELEEWENEKNFKEPCMNLTFGELKKKLLEGNFDGILIASGIDAVELVSFLSPLLLPSRPLTIFHTASNYLYPVFQTLRSRHDYLLVNLYTTWFRPYQVLPGRIRPTMTMSGNGGALLVATKVIDGPSVPCTLTPSELKLSNHLKRKRDRVPTT